jgi:hypothetical protein
MSIETAENKLWEFLDLPRGWHLGEGEPVCPCAAESALSLMHLADKNGFGVDVFPGVDGNVLVRCMKDDISLYFDIKSCGNSVDYFMEIKDEEIEDADDITLQAATEKLSQHVGK